MIVTNVEQGWEIIYQPAHGLLAGFLASHFAEDRQGRFWFETVSAITAHDDSKVAFQSGEHTYVTDVGAPKDFTLVSFTAQQRFDEVSQRIENAYRKHRWVGLLESLHAHTLYDGNTTSKRLTQLLEREEERRRAVLQSLQVRKDELLKAYDIMRWCDRCSLILCQNSVPQMDRKLEIITDSNNTTYMIHRSDGSEIAIDPWPFAEDSFEASVEVNRLSELKFEDDAELKQKLNEQSPIIRTWVLKKKSD